MKNKTLLFLVSILQASACLSENLLNNPNFDTGGNSTFTLSPWTTWAPAGKVGVFETEHSTSKPKAVRLDGGTASVEQLVTGLTPNTTYRFSAWVHTTGANKASLGVKHYLTSTSGELTVENSTSGYEFLTLDFTTGNSATSAKVYLLTDQTDDVYGDDFSVDKLPLAVKKYVVNGDFESGGIQPWSNSQLTYCTAIGEDPAADRWISSLSTSNASLNITSYTGSSYPSNGYSLYDGETLTVTPGLDFNLAMLNTDKTRWSRIKAWIDWNGDGDFADSGEEVFYLGGASTDNIASTVNINRSIAVPTSAAVGDTRLRIHFEDAWNGVPTPCGYSLKTSTFDFYVNISTGNSGSSSEKITSSPADVHNGIYAAEISGSGTLASQSNLSLKAGTKYQLKAWAKAGTADNISIGIKNFTGGILSPALQATTSNSTYTELSVPFTTGVFPAEAAVFFETTTPGTAFIDDITITEVLSLGPLSEGNVPSETVLSNPERGFRFEAIVQVPDLNNPWNLSESYNVNTLLTDFENEMDANDGHVRLSQWYVYLSQFKDAPLSQAALDAITTSFNAFRDKGYKMVLRFVYQAPEAEAPYKNIKPSASRILGHLEQLKPLVQANIDVVHTLQMGLIGAWGEWHSFGLSYNQTDKNNLVAKILDILPAGRQTQMRSIGDRNNISTAAVSNAAKDSQIGFHNDFFGDSTTYAADSSGYYASTDYNTVKSKSANLLVDGESGWSRDCNDNAGCIWQVSELFDVYEVLVQFLDHHYTSYSLAHGYHANNAYWKRFLLSKESLASLNIPYHPEYFKNNQGDDTHRTAYEYIRDHLGYRLYLKLGNEAFTQNDNELNYSIDIQNYGFSAIHNPREVNVVLLDGANNVVATHLSAANPTTWQPYTPADANRTTLTHNITGNLTLPQGITPASDYKIGIWLADPILKNNKKYDITLANRTNMSVFENNTQKINIVKENITLSSVSEASYCSATGADPAADRWISSLNTTGALANITNYTGTSYPSNGYNLYTAQTLNAEIGSSFNLAMVNTDKTKWSRIKAWIDWNHDGDFTDSGEELFYLGNASTNNIASTVNINQSITVPSTAAVGSTRLRIRFEDAWNGAPAPCGYSTRTSSFDFSLAISH